MRRSSERDELGGRVIAILRDGEFELTTVADQVDEEIGPVFARIRRFVNEGVVRSPRPGVYTLTETERESPSRRAARDE